MAEQTGYRRLTILGNIMQVTISTLTVKATIGALQADTAASNRWVKATDLLIADGVTSALLASKGGNADLRDFVKSDIVLASFTAKDQAMIAKEGKSLTDEQKSAKRYLQQQIGSKLGKIEAHLKKAEAAAEADAMSDEEAKEEKAKQASIKARLDKDLASWIVRLEKCEASDFVSIADVIKSLKIAQTVCNATK